MRYRVTGVGGDGRTPLEYWQTSLQHASYLAEKMIDQGVRDVRIMDTDGSIVAPLPSDQWGEPSDPESTQ